MEKRTRGQGKTPHRVIRVDDELWENFGRSAEYAEADRSSVLRDFIRWYTHERGAKMPNRPPNPDRSGKVC